MPFKAPLMSSRNRPAVLTYAFLGCRDLFAGIIASEAKYDEITPGREAQIRLIGCSGVLKEKAIPVCGRAAVVEEPSLLQRHR